MRTDVPSFAVDVPSVAVEVPIPWLLTYRPWLSKYRFRQCRTGRGLIDANRTG